MLDLITNGTSIRDALTQVECGEKTWLWLGYSASTDTLQVKSTGDKLEKMLKHAKPSEVLYGYARLVEKSASVAKYVFVLWLGTASLKNKTIEYIRNGEEIAKLCKTIHLQISARDVSDVNWDEIVGKIFGNLNASAPQDQLGLSNETAEEPPQKSTQAVTDFKSLVLSGIVAARIKNLYEQKTSSAYKPVDFVEELEAARAMPRDPIDPIQGAAYERPDFRADIAQRESSAYVEQSQPTKTKPSKTSSRQCHGSVSHSSSNKSKVAVSSVSMSTSSVQVKPPAVATMSVSLLTEDVDVDVNGRYDFDGICLFRFEKAMDDEITIIPGDRITNICRFDDKWLWGTTADGQSGRFPKSYVELFEANAKEL
uniref:SH3 domain-containing protein n=2 Tax=Mesocestoides corti TaxID=53468 RepID=A0A5K3F3D2_MESCO